MPNAVSSDRLPLKPLVVGSRISGTACVRRKTPGRTRDGAPYLTVELSNVTGSASGKVWRDRVPEWDQIPVGSAVAVDCVVKGGFNGGPPELDIAAVRGIGDHPVRLELNALCATPLEALQQRYVALLDELPPRLKALHDVVIAYVGPERVWTAPAAKGHHHAYIRGLVEHSIEVAEIALRASEIAAYRDHVDRGALVLGALLHDVGKVEEYAWEGCPIDISPVGRLRHHTSIGAELVALAAITGGYHLRDAGCTAQDIAHLQHVQQSHHGKPEWGSSVEPASLEAVLIHLADMTSARARAVLDDLLSEEPDAQGWVQPAGFRKRPVYYTHHHSHHHTRDGMRASTPLDVSATLPAGAHAAGAPDLGADQPLITLVIAND